MFIPLKALLLFQNDDELYSNGKPEKESQNSICLDASVLGDIPARYAISYISHYELPVIGIYVDPKIVPGFYYKVRILTEEVKRSLSTLN